MKLVTEMITRATLDCGTQFLRIDSGKVWVELEYDPEPPFHTYAWDRTDATELEELYSQTLQANLAALQK